MSGRVGECGGRGGQEGGGGGVKGEDFDRVFV
jgi:hypothetical protein